MARKRSTPANRTRTRRTNPELVQEEGYWWIVQGTKRINAGRNRRYAEQLLAQQQPQ